MAKIPTAAQAMATVLRLAAGQRSRRGEASRAAAARRRKAAAEKRRREADARREAWWAERAKRRDYSVDQVALMLSVMEPGNWYGRLDICNGAGLTRDHRGVVTQKLLARRWVRRMKNPAWRGGVNSRSPVGPHEPQWLYQITEEGTARRARPETGTWSRRRRQRRLAQLGT